MSNYNYTLQIGGFPIIKNLEDLANLIHLSKRLLYRLSKFNNEYYKIFKMPKKNGGYRVIYCPAKDMKAVQAWILRNILEKIHIVDCATAFTKGKNILFNAKLHKGNRHFLCLDIENFFPSIPYRKVFTIFRAIGYNPHVSHILSAYCTCGGILPQGGVTSPAISNIVCIKLDNRISGYAGKYNITYSRYADDLIFSSMSPGQLVGIKKFVTKIIREEGFELNNHKTRFLGPRRQRKVTGLVFSEKYIGIGRKKKRILRAAIHRIVTKKYSLKKENRLVRSIKGWFAFLNDVDRKGLMQLRVYTKKLKLKYKNNQVLKSLLN